MAGWEALEKLAVDKFQMNVKARQPQRHADDEKKGRQPAPPAEHLKRTQVDQEGRRYTEADHVHQRVVFLARIADGMGEPGDPAINRVKGGRYNDCP